MEWIKAHKGLVWFIGIPLFVIFSGLSCVGSYNGLYETGIKIATTTDERLSNLDEAYRHRADIIPNMVETVMSEVGAETKLDVEYAEARAKMGGQIKLTPEALKDPKAMEAFKTQQGTLGNFLSRIMSVAEKIPNPNFSKAYADLRRTLDGENNRIGIAIKDYNAAAKKNNEWIQAPLISVRRFVVSGSTDKFYKRDYYKVEEEKKANPNLKDLNMRTKS
jgi:hypothetical protein